MESNLTYGFSIEFPDTDMPSAVSHLTVGQALELHNALSFEGLHAQFIPLSPLNSDERKQFSFLGASLKNGSSGSAWGWAVVLNRTKHLLIALENKTLPNDEIPSLLTLAAEKGAVDALEVLIEFAPHDALLPAMKAADLAKKTAKPQTPQCRKIECCASILKDVLNSRQRKERAPAKSSLASPAASNPLSNVAQQNSNPSPVSGFVQTDEIQSTVDSSGRVKPQRRPDVRPYPSVKLPDNEPRMRLSEILGKQSPNEET